MSVSDILSYELRLWLGLLFFIVAVPLLFLLKYGLIIIFRIVKGYISKVQHKRNLKIMKNELVNQGIKDSEQVELQKSEIEDEERPKSVAKDLIKNKLERIKYEAIVLREKGDLEAYEKKLIEGLSVDSKNLEMIKFLGNYYFLLGKYRKALPLLKRILENEVNDHKTIWQIGVIYMEKEDYDTAKLLINKSLEIKTDNPKYYETMAEILYNCDDIEGAIKLMKKVLKLRPTNIKYLQLIASLYEEFGDFNKARNYYLKILELDSTNEDIRNKLYSLG